MAAEDTQAAVAAPEEDPLTGKLDGGLLRKGSRCGLWLP